MLSLVRTSAARQFPKHLVKAAAFQAVQRAPGACRAFSNVPKTMKVRAPNACSRLPRARLSTACLLARNQRCLAPGLAAGTLYQTPVHDVRESDCNGHLCPR